MDPVVGAVSELLAHARGHEAASVFGLIPTIERLRDRPLQVSVVTISPLASSGSGAVIRNGTRFTTPRGSRLPIGPLLMNSGTCCWGTGGCPRWRLQNGRFPRSGMTWPV